MRSIRSRTILYVAAPVVVIMVAAATLEFVPLHYFSEAELTSRIKSWGPWGVAGSIALMIAHSVIPFPAEILALANGMVYGPVWGAVVTWVGAMLGALSSFGLARLFGRPLVRRLIPSGLWAKIDQLSERGDAAGALLLLRLVPIIAFNAINFAAGLANVRLWTYFWTTAIGIVPVTVITAFAGAEVLQLQWWVWVLLAALLIATWIIWHSIHRARD